MRTTRGGALVDWKGPGHYVFLSSLRWEPINVMLTPLGSTLFVWLDECDLVEG